MAELGRSYSETEAGSELEPSWIQVDSKGTQSGRFRTLRVRSGDYLKFIFGNQLGELVLILDENASSDQGDHIIAHQII